MGRVPTYKPFHKRRLYPVIKEIICIIKRRSSKKGSSLVFTPSFSLLRKQLECTPFLIFYKDLQIFVVNDVHTDQIDGC